MPEEQPDSDTKLGTETGSNVEAITKRRKQQKRKQSLKFFISAHLK